MQKKTLKPQLTAKQLKAIQWLENPKEKDGIRVGRYKDYWILSQNQQGAPVLVYTQEEWDAFVDGVKKHEFDDLIEK